ncbi:MAG: ABC transporter ATP-binding protein [Geminicoccaceae bacterium]
MQSTRRSWRGQRVVAEKPAVEALAACREYGSAGDVVRALDHVDVTIAKGEFFTLLGPSGCGKTTLLRLIAGFEQPTSGSIRLNGEDITGDPPNRRRVNTVFQSYALFPHMTVSGNIAFGLEMLGRPRGEIRSTVDRMLALVQMESMAGRRPQQLSGGQQQRVALARALAPSPEVLLLDEPLSALDLKLRKEMQLELKRLQHETGITFIFVTHDQEEALTMSDRIGVMRQGRLLQVGRPREIYNQPVNRFVADFIGETNFLEVTVNGGAFLLNNGERLPLNVENQPAENSRSTLAIRPEQIVILPDETNEGIRGIISETIYSGTATHCHLKLSDGSGLVARVSSPPSGDIGLAPGASVAIAFAPGAVRVLED